MKNLKLKLMSAIAMLMVATIGLASVSFAWFTISTNPEVSQMKMNVAANENLEIALDNGYTKDADVNDASKNTTAGGVQGSTAGNPYTWGNLINLDYGFYTANLLASGTKNVVGSLYLNPVKYVKDATSGVAELQYPKYADDGRIAGLAALTANNVKASSLLTTAAAGGLKVYSEDATIGEKTNLDAFSVTYWLRSNMAAKVGLSATGVERAKSSTGGDASPDVYANLDGDVNQMKGSGSFVELPSSATNDTKGKLLKWIQDGKLVIQFDVVNPSDNKVTTTYYAQPVETAAAAKYTLKLMKKTGSGYESATIDLAANTAQKINMYVYINGEAITNADAFLDDISNIGLNIQFTDTNDEASKINDAMDAGATAVTEPDNYMHSGN